MSAAGSPEPPPIIEEPEAVDGEPVLEAPELRPVPVAETAVSTLGSPAVAAAAAAATGFVAGAATLALARRRSARRLARAGARRRADTLPILGTRSFVIDIHTLRPDR